MDIREMAQECARLDDEVYQLKWDLEATPVDRGGKDGPRYKAQQALIDAEVAAREAQLRLLHEINSAPPSAENPAAKSLETSLHDRKLSVRVDGKLISTIVDVHGLSLVSLRSSDRLVDLAVHGADGKPKCVTLRY